MITVLVLHLQKDGIPTILGGHNTLLTAETGCGKTLAYLLPMINQILVWQMLLRERQLNSPLGIVVSPNRELANQIGVSSHCYLLVTHECNFPLY